jgi:CheY-like chemotaxis protein
MPPRNKTLIVAEDDSNVLMSMCIVLERLGYDAIPAENGIEVMRLLRIISPDAITLDLRMPLLDGVDTLRMIKGSEQYKNIPVIMVSGHSNTEVVKECEGLGCVCFLPKPTGMTDLNSALERNLFPERERRHVRTNLNIKVTVNYDGGSHRLYTKTLSERGVFIRTRQPFDPGSNVEVVLPLHDGTAAVRGTVIYATGFEDHQPGMAIEFKDIPEKTASRINEFVLQAIAKDIDGLVV